MTPGRHSRKVKRWKKCSLPPVQCTVPVLRAPFPRQIVTWCSQDRSQHDSPDSSRLQIHSGSFCQSLACYQRFVAVVDSLKWLWFQSLCSFALLNLQNFCPGKWQEYIFSSTASFWAVRSCSLLHSCSLIPLKTAKKKPCTPSSTSKVPDCCDCRWLL